jgi:hypothetical protein
VATQGKVARVPGKTWRSQSACQRTHEGLGGERGHPGLLPYSQQAQHQRQAIGFPAWAPFVGEVFKDVIEGQRINLLPRFDWRQGSAERVIVHSGLCRAFNEG